MTALLLLKRFWPALALISVGIALWAYGNSRYEAGVKAERGKWEQETERLRAVVAEQALQLQLATNAADDAARASAAALEALATQTERTRNAYYRGKPAMPCLSNERLRAIAESDASATAAAKAPK
jgi:hypothetical protein